MLTSEQIKEIRKKANLTHKEMSQLFGFKSVGAWQKKEAKGDCKRTLNFAEEQYFLLITGFHPTKKIVEK